MKKKRLLKKVVSVLLAVVIVIGLIPMMHGNMAIVQAAESNNSTKTIAGLGTSIISDPVAPENAMGVWTGSYVYFGMYDTDSDDTAEPVKYRVLDSNTTVFSGNSNKATMLLDCNSVLWSGNDPSSAFDADSDVWEDSDIREYLNGTFLSNSFSIVEQNAIASSIKDNIHNTDGTAPNHLPYVPLAGDKVFFLDASEVTNESYGYVNSIFQAKNRSKTGAGINYWWLRSANTDYNMFASGCVSNTGMIYDTGVTYNTVGVSPALNVNLSSVLFSSVIYGTAGQTGAEYKLTLLDENMTIAGNGTVTRNNDTVIIPYSISGTSSANATQASILLLDKEYTTGNTNDADVIFYDALSNDDSFDLPLELSDKVCGRDYYAYIVAEDVNGTYKTDYASEPVEISIPWIAKSMNFSTNGIIDPIVPTSTSDVWTGSYVYFGTYNGSPVKYRVLDSNTTVFSGNSNDATMLLDCDSVLFGIDNSNSIFDNTNNVWADSDIRAYLNGTFLTDNFSGVEQNAIAPSSKENAHDTDGEGWQFIGYTSLNGEKIFLLDAKEATNTSYGYSGTYYEAMSRDKVNFTIGYWLRSHDIGINLSDRAGYVIGGGSIANYDVYREGGVSPSLNVNLSSILLSSACGTSKSMALTSGSDVIGKTTGTDWKLTLLDARKTVQITENEKVTKATDGTITVPYTYTDNAVYNDEKVNQISVMITDKAYTESDAQIMYYGALQGTDFAAASGTGTFSLPSGLDEKEMGTDYHVYILAEHVDERNFTDYASEPVEIEVYNETLGVTVTDIEAPIGGCALDMSAEVSSDAKTAHVTWMDGENEVTGNAKYNTAHTVKVTLSAIDGYAFTNNTEVTLNGNAVTTHRNNDGTLTVSYTFPVTEMGTIAHTSTGYEGTYDGNAHLITVVVTEPESTTVTYSTDEGNNKTYSETNPVFTDAGTYTVYYKIEHNDYITVTGSQTVKINKKAVTVTAKDQTVTEGDGIDSSKYTVSGLLEGHSINKVTLIPSTNVVTEDGSIEVHLDKIVDLAGEDVTANYEITLTEGKLVVEQYENDTNSNLNDEEESNSTLDDENGNSEDGDKDVIPDEEDRETEDSKDNPSGEDNVPNNDTEDDSSSDDSDKLDETPDTGDNSHIYICVMLSILSSIVIVHFSRKRKHMVNE